MNSDDFRQDYIPVRTELLILKKFQNDSPYNTKENFGKIARVIAEQSIDMPFMEFDGLNLNPIVKN